MSQNYTSSELVGVTGNKNNIVNVNSTAEATSVGIRNGEKLNEELLKNVIMEDIRLSAKRLKSDFMEQIEMKLGEMVDGMVDSLEKSEPPIFLSNSFLKKSEKRTRIAGKLPEKEFKSQPSLLTELFEIPHFKTIHHIVIATLALFIINTIITELLETGTVDLGMEGFSFGFGKPQITLGILAGMHLVTLFVVYPAFSIWTTYRQTLEKGSARLFDYFALSGFLVFLVVFIYIPALIMWRNPLPPASGTAVTMEQCRLLMKIYAFVRSNAPRALNFKEVGQVLKKNETDYDVVDEDKSKKLDYNPSLRKRTLKITSEENQTDSWISRNIESISPYPDYSKYLYFLVAPTLIYRDVYPRTSRIRWSYVSWNFAQVIGCTWYINFIVGRCCYSYFMKFGHPDHKMTLTQFVQTIFALMLPGITTLMLSFFLLLHSWHNAFAEMLCFGDRQFYKDWWNSSSFASYYKTWNCIVHDWLYTYVYKDAWEFGLGSKHSAIPTALVFLISCLFHEYILSFTFNFFFPVLLTLFGGFGFPLVFIRGGQNAVGNVLMWMALISGTGIIFTLYGFEYFARINCPIPDEITTMDFFKPRALSLSCGAFSTSF